MKIVILLFALLFASITYSQSVSNMSLSGNRNDFTAGGTPSGFHYASCWGYAANGREYAIIGHYAGTTVYDITNSPAVITNVGTVAGPLEAGLGALWGEDPRYVRVSNKPFRARIGNVFLMSFVARSRSGRLNSRLPVTTV